jgi:predicted metal-dependent hydrolase
VQLEFHLPARLPAPKTGAESVVVGARTIPLWLARHPRARRYVLRLRRDGIARVTIPRGGSAAEARRFVERNLPWLERQLLRQALHPTGPRSWGVGSEIFFRGRLVRLEAVAGEGNTIALEAERVRVAGVAGEDLRPDVERHLWRLAARELPPRVLELARPHQYQVRRITVRNQRSRWGSCSRRGTVSLNWRLVQAPEFVRDYIILHELAHLRHPNHSRRFWDEVARLCPGFAQAEAWLKEHSALLR